VDGYARFKKDNKWGLLDSVGNIWIDAIYNNLQPLGEGYSSVKKGREAAILINKTKKIIKGYFESVSGFSENLFVVQNDNKWGYADTSGILYIDCKFEYAGKFSNGFAPVKLNEKYGLIDIRGKIIIPFIYDNIYLNKNEIYALTKDGWVVLDETGNKLLKNAYNTEYLVFNDGISAVEGINGKYFKGGSIYIDLFEKLYSEEYSYTGDRR
jgi:hypothetical protein